MSNLSIFFSGIEVVAPDSLEEALTCDDLFLEYFNKFLSLPVSIQTCLLAQVIDKQRYNRKALSCLATIKTNVFKFTSRELSDFGANSSHVRN